MSDLYTEVIVKRKATAGDTIKKSLLIAGTALSAFAFFFTPLGILAVLLLAGFALADYFLLPNFNVEYEYLYVNGELDIDKIMSKQKRKRVFSMDIKNLEILAPSQSHALDHYNRSRDLKTFDFSSREESHKTYTMVVKGEKGMQKVIFEPNDVILNDMKRVAPREVNLM